LHFGKRAPPHFLRNFFLLRLPSGPTRPLWDLSVFRSFGTLLSVFFSFWATFSFVSFLFFFAAPETPVPLGPRRRRVFFLVIHCAAVPRFPHCPSPSSLRPPPPNNVLSPHILSEKHNHPDSSFLSTSFSSFSLVVWTEDFFRNGSQTLSARQVLPPVIWQGQLCPGKISGNALVSMPPSPPPPPPWDHP